MQAPGPPPHPQAFQDAEHLKLLSIFHYVLGGMIALFGCLFICYIMVGGLIASGQLPSGASPPPPKEMGLAVMAVGFFVILLAWGMAAALILAGRWIGERKNWTYCFVMACISCISFPLGTALGVFTIIVLQKLSVKMLFGRPLPGGYLNS